MASAPPFPSRRRRTSPPLKTYQHLASERRVPSDYEIVSTRLLYYAERGFEVKTPISAWYERHQRGSLLRSDAWESFVDPRQTTYAQYTRLAAARETYVDGILHSMEESGYDATLRREWVAVLDRVLAPLRYPAHGLQMVSAYVGQMAPSGRVTIAAAFQAADELRRVHRIAYRMAQLKLLEPAFGDGSRAAWQGDPAWQPLREAVERCLVTYDWAEALVALNLCIKPIIDELFLVLFPRVARERGDYLLGQILASFEEDARWHRAWTVAALQTAIAGDESNRGVIAAWVARWSPLALRAARAFEFLVPPGTLEPALTRAQSGLLEKLGIEAPRS